MLTLGPDILWDGPYRLELPGDFNADIDPNLLSPGMNDVVFTATDDQDNVTVEVCRVDYTTGVVWPDSYTIDWNTVTDIQDVAQVVDGVWEIQDDPFNPGQIICRTAGNCVNRSGGSHDRPVSDARFDSWWRIVYGHRVGGNRALPTEEIGRACLQGIDPIGRQEPRLGPWARAYDTHKAVSVVEVDFNVSHPAGWIAGCPTHNVATASEEGTVSRCLYLHGRVIRIDINRTATLYNFVLKRQGGGNFTLR